jgi:4-amino-4-deoxychorismate lyase
VNASAAAPLALAVAGHGLVDASRPWLHLDDDAVLRGRAAFETARLYNGRPYRLGDHLSRLAASAAALDLPPPDLASLADCAGRAAVAAGVPEAMLRIVWTAGSATRTPLGFALASPIPAGLDRARAAGLAVVTLQLAVAARRRASLPWLLAGAKSTSYAVNMAAQREAARRGADDAVFVALEGDVLEATTSNVWLREGRRLLTPPLDLDILAGMTRDSLLALAPAAGCEAAEERFDVERLAAADEAFCSSSVREIMPVVRIDGRPVAGGRPGPAAVRLQGALRESALRATAAPS